MYFVKGLEHCERYLRWAKAKYPRIQILQTPHWNMTYNLRSGVFCVPNPKVKLLTLAGIDNAVRAKTGIGYSFFGMKKADSIHRRLMLNTYEGGISARRCVYPLQDFKKNEVLRYIEQHKLPMPVMYGTKASGGAGFNLDCYLYLREHYPQDLQKILRAFPMSEKLLVDYDAAYQREYEKHITQIQNDGGTQ